MMTLHMFLDQTVADARAELGLPPLPPPIPSLESIIAQSVSRARAELADDAREIERGNSLEIDFAFIAGVDRWARIENAARRQQQRQQADEERLADAWAVAEAGAA